MTAKEALLARIDQLGEEDAAALLPLADSVFLEWLECVSKSTSTDESLKLPGEFQVLLSRYEERFIPRLTVLKRSRCLRSGRPARGSDVDLIDG